MADEPLPGDYPLTIYKGDSRAWSVLLEDVDAAGVATPKDLTGHTFLAEIRSNDGAGTVLATITVDSTNAATGVLGLSLSAAASAALTPPADGEAQAAWDLQVTRTSDGFVRTYLRGEVELLGDVSRV